MTITFTSEIKVELIQSVGGDLSVVRAARVATVGSRAIADPEKDSLESQEKLIDYLMRHRHGSPYEHSQLTFFVHAPAMVWWEWVRHRIGQTIDCETEQAFNLESGRYRQLEPVFWIPHPSRKMVPAPDHKAARPRFVEAADWVYDATVDAMKLAYTKAWDSYRLMIDGGIANEVARAVLGFGVYYSGWVTCNPRSLMAFLSLRTHDESAKFISYPQAEIEQAARTAERFLEEGWPFVYRSFNRHGRVAP